METRIWIMVITEHNTYNKLSTKNRRAAFMQLTAAVQRDISGSEKRLHFAIKISDGFPLFFWGQDEIIHKIFISQTV